MTHSFAKPDDAISSSPLVRLEEIEKSFDGNLVLDRVSLTIDEGEVCALLGENGAGKSTLGKILGGIYRPDSGAIQVADFRTKGWSTRFALSRGVATIQQELCLVPDLTVAENVFLGIETRRAGLLRNDTRQRFAKLEDTYHFALSPSSLVRDLGPAQRQKVEIMRALARSARVIIMDEPTTSLTADEIGTLHQTVRSLCAGGTTIVYITHSLSAALEMSQRVAILRDGKLIRTGPSNAETEDSLVEAMLGRAVDVFFPQLPPAPPRDTSPALELRRLRSGSAVRNVSLTVSAGEIVGLAGLVGSGRTEVLRAVYGADPFQAGEILINGQLHRPKSVRASIGAGVALVPEDRRRQGLIPTQDVRSNIALPSGTGYRRGVFLSSGRESRMAEDIVKSLNIVPPRVRANVATLSGGNQQKVTFGKWLAISPSVLLLDEPTRGVDVGAKVQIHRLIADLARQGTAILLVSSDLEEVLGLSHRIYLIKSGRTIGEFAADAVTLQDVLIALMANRSTGDSGAASETISSQPGDNGPE